MELNIKVKIDSPDILNGLLALADEISKIGVAPKQIVQAVKPDTEDKAKKDIKEEKKEEAPKAITLEEVRSKLTSLSQSGKQAEVKALIKGFGVAKLTDIPKEKYTELLKAAEEI